LNLGFQLTLFDTNVLNYVSEMKRYCHEHFHDMLATLYIVPELP